MSLEFQKVPTLEEFPESKPKSEKDADPILSLINELKTGDNNIEASEAITDELLMLLEQFFETKLTEGRAEFNKIALNPIFMDDEEKNFTRLIRSVNLSDVIKTYEGENTLAVGNEADHYANSGKPTFDATRIAISEGKTEGGCKTVISFKVNHLEVHPVEIRPEDFRDQKHRKEHLKHIIGYISPEDINYILLRFPVLSFPMHLMNEEEMEIYNEKLDKVAKGINLTNEQEERYFVFRGLDVQSKEELSESQENLKEAA